MAWNTVYVLIEPVTQAHLASVGDESLFRVAQQKLARYGEGSDPEQQQFDFWDPDTFKIVTGIAEEDWPPMGIINRDSEWIDPACSSFNEATAQVKNPRPTERVVVVSCHY